MPTYTVANKIAPRGLYSCCCTGSGEIRTCYFKIIDAQHFAFLTWKTCSFPDSFFGFGISIASQFWWCASLSLEMEFSYSTRFVRIRRFSVVSWGNLLFLAFCSCKILHAEFFPCGPLPLTLIMVPVKVTMSCTHFQLRTMDPEIAKTFLRTPPGPAQGCERFAGV